MQEIPWLTAQDVADLVPMHDAVTALRSAFAAGVSHAPRLHLRGATSEFLVMPAAGPDSFGTKLVTVVPANAGTSRPIIQGVYALFDAATGSPVALVDAAALTTLRTPAVSAVATDALARRDVRTIGVLGTGPQADAHAVAVRTVRPGANSVVVAGRTRQHVQAVVDKLIGAGFDARPGTFADAAACDVVCACTRADQPLFQRSDVRPGAHLNLVGSYRLDLREVAADVVAGSTVVVDDVAAAKAEAGDLEYAVREGMWTWDLVAGDLCDAAAARVTRTSDQEITLFKSVGLAVQDLVVAQLAAARWAAQQVNP